MTNDLILEGDKIISLAENKFIKSVRGSESVILEEIKKLFDVVDVSGGKLRSNEKTIEFLASLEKRILTALKKSGYSESVLGLLKNFDKIQDNNIKLAKSVNDVLVGKNQLSSLTKLEVQNATDKLIGSGISKDFIIPIKQSLYRNITTGANVDDAKETIENFLVSKGKKKSHLLRYASQVARDTLSQYDGALQAAIGNELGLNDYLYAGSIIEDSRGQCVHWVNKKYLEREELIDEIATAVNNGYLGGQKCSGMIPDTTIDTFAINRGGYNCRHRAIRTKAKK